MTAPNSIAYNMQIALYIYGYSLFPSRKSSCLGDPFHFFFSLTALFICKFVLLCSITLFTIWRMLAKIENRVQKCIIA